MRLSFDTIANQFDDQRGLPQNALRAWMGLIDSLAAGAQLSIIEPGIGTGRISLPLAAMGHHVIGTDISGPMLAQCQARAASLGLTDRVSMIEADATDLPIADHAFDIGIIAQLLYLVDDWPSVLDEFARVMRPGGLVIHLTEPTTESGALALWSHTWREMIEATGYRHMPPIPMDDDVHAEFLRRWPDVQVKNLVSWSFGQTVAAAMDGYAKRLRGLYPDVSTSAFNEVVEHFLAWAVVSFPDTNIHLDGTVTLTVMIAAV